MWLQTGDYTLEGLYWLIAIAAIFVIAIVALIVAGSAKSSARTARRYADGFRAAGAVNRPNVIVQDGPRNSLNGEAFKVLDERYAKGEITREEYMQRQTDLAEQREVPTL